MTKNAEDVQGLNKISMPSKKVVLEGCGHIIPEKFTFFHRKKNSFLPVHN